MDYVLRRATDDDADFLTGMLVEAADWRHPPDTPGRAERALADERVRRYVSDWRRPGDLGVIAVDAAGTPIGAAWSRLFTAGVAAFGFVAADVPELAIGVRADRRGLGVGRALLAALLDTATAAGFRRISLSVDHDNPAAALYRATGFTVVESRATAATMVRALTP
ncbi:L-amino acid N-acyltransferase YncA [Stackebrandtia albiflava]|uniref:L-amino acid N-acyltransferase YncA n=1 Tax=Stackebrandtia albiflava TaxID=406432 RepID=A0A562V9M0_9ACTN|nr:GNAT family N-acetyltransferase [Stackebrandtia albiflava]TWJ14570.1 L-amino acid N-acyltransferase YncA [Stackebrandtia albiflava]